MPNIRDFLPPPPWEGPPLPRGWIDAYFDQVAMAPAEFPWFHGTNLSYTSKILQEGLTPQLVPEDPEKGPRVFLTPTPFYAAVYGDTILRVRIPKEMERFIIPGTETVWSVDWTIPPEDIDVYGQVVNRGPWETENNLVFQRVEIKLADGRVITGRTFG